MYKMLFSLLLMTGAQASLAETCDQLLADPAAFSTPDQARFGALVDCQVDALREVFFGDSEAASRCQAAFSIAARLDLSQIPSSLGPRIEGPTTMTDLGDVRIAAACSAVEFGETDWERQFEIIAVSETLAAVRLTDRSRTADYNRPGAFLVQSGFDGGLRIEGFCEVAARSPDLVAEGCN